MFTFLKKSSGKILELFFKNPEKEYYLREIARLLGKEPGFFQKTINDFVREGILQDRKKGGARYFHLNKTYPLYNEIKSIVSKTIGVEARLRDLSDEMPDIECAFIFGSMATGKEHILSDIDIIFIGKIDEDLLLEKITPLESEMEREINYHIYTKDEIKRKMKEKNDFIIRIFKESKIILKGNPDDFTGND